MQRHLPAIVGGIGAMGQAAILFHDLADCYPYKIMSQPPAEFYALIARFGAVIAPVVAMAVAWRLCARATSALPAVATLLCPAGYLLVFVVAHIVAGVEMGATTNFDHTTPMNVAYDFAGRAGELAAVGVGIGAACGLALKDRLSCRGGYQANERRTN
jgi:hypothetical protein